MITPVFNDTVNRAVDISKDLKHDLTTLEHLALAFLDDEEIAPLLKKCGLNFKKFRQEIIEFLNTVFVSVENVQEECAGITVLMQQVIHRSRPFSASGEPLDINSLDVLKSLLIEEDCYAAYFFSKYGVTRSELLKHTSQGIVNVPNLQFKLDQTPIEEPTIQENETPSFHKDSPLELYCIDYLDKAKTGSFPPLIGRQDELDRLTQVLLRHTKYNPLLVGEPGVGKTAIIEGLSLKILEGNVPDFLKSMKIYGLDLASLLAGARYRGDFEERLKSLITELTKSKSKVILFIDEIHAIMGMGATENAGLDAANLLKPVLSGMSGIRCIGTTTYKDLTRIERDKALLRRFQKIDIKEPTRDEAIQILEGVKSRYENHHQMKYQKGVLEAAVDLSIKYITDRKLPDKALDAIDESAAFVRMQKQDNKVRVRDVEETIAKISRIPSFQISTDDKMQIHNLEKELKSHVFGQDAAISTIVSAVKLSRAGLRKGDRPIASFMFAGPTGVGKTELATQLAHSLGVKLLRFDMSEYMEKHSASRLIGTPPGYVGFEQGGLLTDAIDKMPYSVLLLDEIEKAHPDLMTLLLQVMDRGTLTDHTGKVVDCRNLMIIMTTNAGVRELSKSPVGFGDRKRDLNDSAEMNQFFSPEFRGRLDGVITFNPLGRDQIAKVRDKFLKELYEIVESKKYILSFSEEVLNWLLKEGYSEEYGARPMRRVIEEKIKVPLAEVLLFGSAQKGKNIDIQMGDDKVIIHQKRRVLQEEK